MALNKERLLWHPEAIKPSPVLVPVQPAVYLHGDQVWLVTTVGTIRLH